MMMDNWEQEISIACSVEHLGVVYENCTIRIRGDTSRIERKKSYRVEFPPENPLHGRTSWDFNADFYDPSYTRAWLFSRVLTDMGFPCFQVSHCTISVNGDNRGLFMMLEPVDSAFLADNGYNAGGNLYKAAVDGACANIYDDVDSVWSKKTNQSSGMNDLVQLIGDMEHCSPSDFGLFMNSNFVMYGSGGLIRMLAINAVFANNSTYYHNYYLFYDALDTGLWTMFPWDVDKILVSNLRIGYGSSTNLNWYDNPVYARTLVVPEFRQAFMDSVEVIFSSYLTDEKLQYWTDSLKAVLSEAVSQDTYDNTDLQGFLEAEDLLAQNLVLRRNDLMWQFQYRYYPFRSLRSDSISTGQLFTEWLPTETPAGIPAVYDVVVRDSLGPDSDEILRIEGIEGTSCTISGLSPGDYWWTAETDAQAGWRITEATDRYNPFTVVEPAVLSGILGQNTTLYASFSPYLVQGEVTVPSQGSLVIEPGVTLLMSSDGAINCLGTISSAGTPQDSVHIMALNSSLGWRGIRIQGGSATLEYTTVSGSRGFAGSPGNDFAALSGHSTEVTLTNSVFRGNWSCVKLIGGTADIDSCRFTSNRGELFFMQDGDEAFITGSSFINLHDPVASSMDGIEFALCTEGQFTVDGCIVENIDGDCIDMNASSVSIANTRVSSPSDKGFSIGAPTGGGAGGTLVSINNCVITDCPIGVAVKDGASMEGSGIVFSQCDTALFTYEKTSGMGGGFAIVSNSIYTGCAVPVRVDQGSATVSWSISDTTPLAGLGNLQGDPAFAQGFYPAWNSPCIDSGDPEVQDPDGSRSDMGANFFPTGMNGLVVNELMALNTSTILDDWSRSSDWIELYNGAGFDIDAGVLVFFESDSSAAEPWSVSRGTMIPAGGFLLLWADGDQWKQGTHLPFRLSGGGDSFSLGRIVPGNGEEPFISTIEHVQFADQSPDVSYGRFPDGGNWRILETPTPGFSNGTLYSVPTSMSWPRPNPCTTGIVSLDLTSGGGETDVFVYDMAGRKVGSIFDGYLSPGSHTLTWNSDGFPSGIYLIFARCAAQTPATAKVTVLR